VTDIEKNDIVNEENNDVASNTEKKKEDKAADKKAGKSKTAKKSKIIPFFKDIKGELKKITWYPTKQTFITSGLVIGVLAVLVIVIGLVDTGLSAAITALGNLW